MSRFTRRSSAPTRILGAALLITLAGGAMAPRQAAAQEYQKIQGGGSTWAYNAIDDMRVNVAQFGLSVEYSQSGSTAGRNDFVDGLVDFAASDIPFQFGTDGGERDDKLPDPGTYAYIPVVAGGTAFMYNLKIGGKPVTNLRLSGENVAKIFTGVITAWNDPAVQADNPGLLLPAREIRPVVRSDGSGSTAQFTRWIAARHPAIWDDFCQRTGRGAGCSSTSIYPQYSGMIYQSGDPSVAEAVVAPQQEGAIGYVNYSYALNSSAPVVKVLNAAGYYTEPTPENVAVSLLQAEIDFDESNPATYLTQKLEKVYANTDPRNYELSSYSYFVLPTTERPGLSADKGYSLGVFASYAMCEAQQRSASLGYSPLPISLVRPSLEQIKRIPNAVVTKEVSDCDNPTFDPSNPDDPNRLATLAPQPKECDRQGPSQCPDGTGGKSETPTAVLAPQGGGGGSSVGVGTGGGGGTGDVGGAGQPESIDGGSQDNGGSVSSSGGSTGGGTSVGSTGGSTAGSTGSGGTATGNAIGTGGSVSTGTTGSSTDPSGVVVDQGDGGFAVAAIGDESVACDPDTGVCGMASAAGEPVSAGDSSVAGALPAAQAAQVAPAIPATIGRESPYSQGVLTLLIAALAIALLVGPALAWRRFSPVQP